MRQRRPQDGLVLGVIVTLVCVLVLVSVAGGSRSRSQSDSVSSRHTIHVYGFSVWEEVMTEEVFPAFQEYWHEQTGEEVTFQSLFASSEQLTEDILDGAPADVAILSNEHHASWLRISNFTQTDWRTFPEQGVISRSPLVIVVRPDNPLGIRSWADLAHPGVRLVHPDPRTSGGAQWALLAEYGAAVLSEGHEGHDGGAQEAASEQLQGIWDNVVATPASSREALKQFVFGTGDALVTYEQDALLARARGAVLEFVLPPCTIMSEHVVVVVDDNVNPYERPAVEAFVEYLWSEAAQESFTHYYFRAVTDEALNHAVAEFREIEEPFTVRELGGWEQAYPQIIRSLWEERIQKGTD